MVSHVLLVDMSQLVLHQHANTYACRLTDSN